MSWNCGCRVPRPQNPSNDHSRARGIAVISGNFRLPIPGTFSVHVPIEASMSQMCANQVEYRGYCLDAVQYGSGWRVHISPTPRFLRTQPDHVLASTKEEAFAKARAIIDHHLLG